MTQPSTRFVVNALLVVAIALLFIGCMYTGFAAMEKDLRAREARLSAACRANPAACDLPRLSRE